KSADDPAAKLKEREDEYLNHFANPYRAAESGYVDEVIMPSETRKKLIRAFSMLQNKVRNLPKKKHGNIPL
ncbi:MAG: propionyl-CoA carboxylase beta chain, partial [Flavobacteriales bacterium]